MSKLYFYYGTVCSSKTLNLLAVYKNYEVQGRKALLIRPECDTRSKNVESRTGLSAIPDITLNKSSSVYNVICSYINENLNIDDTIQKNQGINIDAIIVDECQFLTVEQIKELRQIATGVCIKINNDKKITLQSTKQSKKEIENIIVSIPVLCYGLRTDCNGELWPSSAVLMAQSDELHEIKTVCSFCNKRAVFSSINPDKIKNENTNLNFNPSWGYYIPVCPEHYFLIKEE